MNLDRIWILEALIQAEFGMQKGVETMIRQEYIYLVHGPGPAEF